MARRALASHDSIVMVVIALGLASASGPSAARQIVDRATVQKTTRADAVVAQADGFKTLADRQAVDELVAALEALPSTYSKGSIAHEALLDRGLHELARLQPSAAAHALVDRIAQMQPEIFVRVDPDHGQHTVPLYDPSATARYVLKTWARTEAGKRAVTALNAGGEWPIDRFSRDDLPADVDAAKAGIVDAFRSVAPERLLPSRGALIEALHRGARVDELASVAAQRLRDPELYGLVLSHADAPVAIKALADVRSTLPDAHALDVLIGASERAEIASAALLEIGRIAREDGRARAHLFGLLSDPHSGSSAAAALAQLRDPGVVADLGRRLQVSSAETERRTLVLALKLDGSPDARAELTQFLKGESGSTSLKSDVRSWLSH